MRNESENSAAPISEIKEDSIHDGEKEIFPWSKNRLSISENDVFTRQWQMPERDNRFGIKPARLYIGTEARNLIDYHIRLTQAENAVYTEQLSGRYIQDAALDTEKRPLRYPTPAQQRMIYYFAADYDNKQIASELQVSEHTIKNHTTHANERMSTKSRYDLIKICIEHGTVLIEADIDFSGYSLLTEREKDLHATLIDPEENTNARTEIVKRMFVEDYTVRFHMRSMLAKMGVKSKEGALLYEIKRKEDIARRSKRDIRLSNWQITHLQLLMSGIDNEKIADLANISVNEEYKDRQGIYNTLSASNMLEAVSHAVFWEILPKNRVADSTQFDRIQLLSPQQKNFLRRYSRYSDGILRSQKNERVGFDKETIANNNVEIQTTLGINNLNVAGVMLIISDLEKHRNMLSEKREIKRLAKNTKLSPQ